MKKHSSPAPAAAPHSKTAANSAAKPSDSGFAYTLPYFESLVDIALMEAKKAGATDAGAEVSEGCGLSVSVRNGELENVERNRDKSLGVTVYVGHRRGNASTSDFSSSSAWSITFSPDLPGMRRSVMTTSKGCACMRLNASSALAATVTS